MNKRFLSLILTAALLISTITAISISTVYAEGYTEKPISSTEDYSSTTKISMATATLTETDGVYTIASLADLGALAAASTEANSYLAGKTVVLTEDLDLAEVAAGIGTFAGTFDGNGKKLSNVKVVLVGTLKGGAEVKNLTVDGATVSSAEASVGVIAGTADATSEIKLTNVALNGVAVSGTTTAAGGAVGSVSGTAALTLENVTVSGSVNGMTYTGGLVGYVSANTASVSFKNCKNEAVLTSSATSGNFHLGGMVSLAYTSTLEGCVNKGAISDENKCTHSSLGGMIGKVDTGALTVRDCVNEGAITSKSTNAYNHQVGGIIGETTGNITAVSIDNCVNKGTLFTTTTTSNGTRAGGIIALFLAKGGVEATISNCSNLGDVTGSAQTGGIVGDMRVKTTVNNCFNSGDVTCTREGSTTGGYMMVGGIIGFTNINAVITISNCTNTGTVTSVGGYTGGILGQARSSFVISGCTNMGMVYSDYDPATQTFAETLTKENSSNSSRVGGVIGSVYYNNNTLTGDVSNCINLGNIFAADCAGGIVGYAQPKTSLDIKSCSNNASITAGYNAAAILGRENGTITISGCTAMGEANSKFTSGTNTGVIFGCKNKTPNVSGCYGWVSVNGTDTAWVDNAADTSKTYADIIGLVNIASFDVQVSKTADGKFTALFLAALNSTDFTGVGFEVYRIIDGEAPSKTLNKASETVYRAIWGYDDDGNEVAVKASELGIGYISAMEIYNIPTDTTVTYVYRPYVVDGENVIYGVWNSVTFTAAK